MNFDITNHTGTEPHTCINKTSPMLSPNRRCRVRCRITTPRSATHRASCMRSKRRTPIRCRAIRCAKSTFSESNSPTSGLTYYDLETRREVRLSRAHAAAQRDPARLRQGRHPGRLARGDRRSTPRACASACPPAIAAACRRWRRQDYTAAYKGIGIETNVDFEARICRPGLRRRARDRRQDRPRSHA